MPANILIVLFLVSMGHNLIDRIGEYFPMKTKPPSLFGNKMFMLDEMTLQNASKFAISLKYEKLKNLVSSIFRFSFHATLFSLMNALDYVDIDQQGIH